MKLTETYNGNPIELELTEEQVEVLKQAEKKKTGCQGFLFKEESVGNRSIILFCNESNVT